MNWANVVQEIEKRFKRFWIDTPIAYGNFAKPSSITDQPWIRVSVRMGDSKRITLGDGWYRTPGLIFVQVFTQSNDGAIVPHALAEKIADILRAQQFSGISCQTPSVNEIGVNSGWSQINVTCPFYTDNYQPVKTDNELLQT